MKKFLQRKCNVNNQRPYIKDNKSIFNPIIPTIKLEYIKLNLQRKLSTFYRADVCQEVGQFGGDVRGVVGRFAAVPLFHHVV